MSTAGLFLTASGVGLAVAAPVGPMGMLCIRRTLTEGPRAGLSIGFGIACGDAIYGLVAALGMVSVSRFMLAYDKPLHLVAGLFLLYLGIRTFMHKPADDAANAAPAPAGMGRAFASSRLRSSKAPAKGLRRRRCGLSSARDCAAATAHRASRRRSVRRK